MTLTGKRFSGAVAVCEASENYLRDIILVPKLRGYLHYHILHCDIMSFERCLCKLVKPPVTYHFEVLV